MTRLVILGDNLASLCGANHALDMNPEMEIQIITERAEIGLVEEIPGLLSSWPPCPTHWISEMGSQTPEPTSKAVRGSWLQKAMGIQLAKRGCIFHLRTRIITISDDSIDFVGAGSVGEGSLTFDYLLDFCSDSSGQDQWYGAVCRSEDSPDTLRQGSRRDGTTEVWSSQVLEKNGKWIQTMIWRGRIQNRLFKIRSSWGRNVLKPLLKQ